MTFVQFIFVASTGYVSQFDRNRPPFFLKPNRVPIRRWLINILLFFTINVLNNHAFSYNISVPIHIILRSGGSITTLIAGYIWGKRFSRIQVLAVMLLTIGVIIAAWSDQQSKVRLATMLGWISLIHLPERRGDSARITSFQHGARHTFCRPNTLSYHGLVYRRDVQGIRPALEREPLLLPPTRIALVHSVPSINEETIPSTGSFDSIRSSYSRTSLESPSEIPTRTGQRPHT